MHRYWFQFDVEFDGKAPPGVIIGCGITAYDYEDALKLLREKVFLCEILPIRSYIEDVDISTLDQGHVLPNMSAPIKRGVWFPLGYD